MKKIIRSDMSTPLIKSNNKNFPMYKKITTMILKLQVLKI